MVRRRKSGKGRIIKRIFITLGIILVIFAGIIIYFVANDFKQEDILKQELINYSNMNLASDDYTIFVKTKGDYAYIEEAVKKFYKELSDNVKIINYYMSDEELKDVLSPERLVAERPDFIKSYAVIQKDRTNVTKALEKISKLCEEETVKNLIDKEKVDKYYYDLYKELMLTKKDIEDLKETKEEMEKLSKNLNVFFDKVVEILDLLKNNDSSWEYHDNQLYFYTDELVNKYNGLYKDLVDIAADFDKQNNTNKNKDSKDIVA
ncbi:MAG: hypothetical protein IJI49_00080 [Bacilli bacterium]|nr:hypothetical protein [Bacilli bacterium]